MKEVQAQSLVIDAVRAFDGAAHKLSNRFMIGVPDLLIALSAHPPMLMEVKLEQRAAGFAERTNHPVMPGVTVPQHSFLTQYAKAGMLCGVMSFVEEAHKGKRGLWLQIVKVAGYDKSYRVGDGLMPHKYVHLTPLNLFDRAVVDMLMEFNNG